MYLASTPSTLIRKSETRLSFSLDNLSSTGLVFTALATSHRTTLASRP
uniref:Uncharacterized protein n=1 Tax=Arundo donax TaxID=35708 RepID=A0A0A9HF30_ARUDO